MTLFLQMFLHFIFIFLFNISFAIVIALPAPRAFLLNCGSSKEVDFDSKTWIPDEGFINTGNISTLKTPGLLPMLTNLRYFTNKTREHCFIFPVTIGDHYLLRTTFFYGGFDGGKEPPVFDQLVDGMKWATVNTAEDYAKGLSSYFEILVVANKKKLSVCIAGNEDTQSSPFISALELNFFENSMYNSTDSKKYALATVARHSFGDQGDMIRFPDDEYNRFWQPFIDPNENPVVESHRILAAPNFYNLPPSRIFRNGITTSRDKELLIDWPPTSLPEGKYHISLYFQDNRTPSPYSWRVFDVFVNDEMFYSDVNVTTEGVMLSAAEWPLKGFTRIRLVPNFGVPVGPVVNAGEVLQLLPIRGRTLRL